jgi:hypothetical protein
MVYNNPSLQFFVNGTVAFSTNVVGGNLRSSTLPFGIGNRATNPGVSFDGLIDEVEIFNRALAGSELFELYRAGTFGKCKPVCTPPPTNMVSWFRGEGTGGGDVFGGNTLTAGNGNGFGFAQGMVGQAFTFSGTQFATAGNPVNLQERRLRSSGAASASPGWRARQRWRGRDRSLGC